MVDFALFSAAFAIPSDSGNLMAWCDRVEWVEQADDNPVYP